MSLYSYGSSHVDFHSECIPKLHAPWKYIDESDLSDHGIEADTHCTVRYGIISGDYAKLYAAISTYHANFDLNVTDIEMFETKDGDCIHWKVEPTKWLLDFRNIVEQDCECAPHKFPTYQPHITIGFVKTGLGKDIVARMKSELNTNFIVQADNFIYAEKSGKRSVIPLCTSKRLAESIIYNKFKMVL